MPDGKRKRRHSIDRAKRRWYAIHRSSRFVRRFGLVESDAGLTRSPSTSNELVLA